MWTRGRSRIRKKLSEFVDTYKAVIFTINTVTTPTPCFLIRRRFLSFEVGVTIIYLCISDVQILN